MNRYGRYTIRTPRRIAFWVIGLLTVFFTAMYLLRGVTSLFQRVPSAVVQPRFFSPFHLVGIIAGAIGMVGLLLAIWSWFVPFVTPAFGTPYPAAGGIWPASQVPIRVATCPRWRQWLAGALRCVLHTRLDAVLRSHVRTLAQTMYVLVSQQVLFRRDLQRLHRSAHGSICPVAVARDRRSWHRRPDPWDRRDVALAWPLAVASCRRSGIDRAVAKAAARASGLRAGCGNRLTFVGSRRVPTR